MCAINKERHREKYGTKLDFSFKEHHIDMNDSPRSGRPSEFDKNCINASIPDDPRQLTRELGTTINCGKSTIVRHLHSMNNVQHLIGCENEKKKQKSVLFYFMTSSGFYVQYYYDYILHDVDSIQY